MDRRPDRSFDRLFMCEDAPSLVPARSSLRRALVVGSGVAGLQTARQMRGLGLEVLVLEQSDDIGGVWQRNYHGFGLQVPWRLYQFPEFPWPRHMQPSIDYPTGQEVQAYVKAYAEHFDLLRLVRLRCKLLRLRWNAARRTWDALYCDTAAERFFKVTADYCVICAGIYSQPYIPDYEGAPAYAGIQLHAKDFTDLSLARGRRVVVVGAGKTALDCVSNVVAANTATSVTLLYRQAHWPVPRNMLGTSVRSVMFNRAMTTMLPPFYNAGGAAAAVGRAMAPLRRLFWKGMESLISQKFHITEQMRPRVSLPTDLFYGGQILDNKMDKLIRNGQLATVRGEIARFVRNGVILQDSSFVAADLVLYCTGYLKSYEYLEGDMRARLDLQKDGLYLYRNVLPYAVPHLAFVGSEVSTYNNILTSGLQALWLASVLSGRVQLPHPSAMLDDIRAQQRWRRTVMPPQRNRGSVLMLYMIAYHDQLLCDMGQRPKRKGINVFAECFGAYTAKDYRALMRLPQEDRECEGSSGEARAAARERLTAAGVPAAVIAAAAAGHAGLVTAPPPQVAAAALPVARAPVGEEYAAVEGGGGHVGIVEGGNGPLSPVVAAAAGPEQRRYAGSSGGAYGSQGWAGGVLAHSAGGAAFRRGSVGGGVDGRASRPDSPRTSCPASPKMLRAGSSNAHNPSGSQPLWAAAEAQQRDAVQYGRQASDHMAEAAGAAAAAAASRGEEYDCFDTGSQSPLAAPRSRPSLVYSGTGRFRQASRTGTGGRYSVDSYVAGTSAGSPPPHGRSVGGMNVSRAVPMPGSPLATSYGSTAGPPVYGKASMPNMGYDGSISARNGIVGAIGAAPSFSGPASAGLSVGDNGLACSGTSYSGDISGSVSPPVSHGTPGSTSARSFTGDSRASGRDVSVVVPLPHSPTHLQQLQQQQHPWALVPSPSRLSRNTGPGSPPGQATGPHSLHQHHGQSQGRSPSGLRSPKGLSYADPAFRSAQLTNQRPSGGGFASGSCASGGSGGGGGAMQHSGAATSTSVASPHTAAAVQQAHERVTADLPYHEGAEDGLSYDRSVVHSASVLRHVTFAGVEGPREDGQVPPAASGQAPVPYQYGSQSTQCGPHSSRSSLEAPKGCDAAGSVRHWQGAPSDVSGGTARDGSPGGVCAAAAAHDSGTEEPSSPFRAPVGGASSGADVLLSTGGHDPECAGTHASGHPWQGRGPGHGQQHADVQDFVNVRQGAAGSNDSVYLGSLSGSAISNAPRGASSSCSNGMAMAFQQAPSERSSHQYSANVHQQQQQQQSTTTIGGWRQDTSGPPATPPGLVRTAPPSAPANSVAPEPYGYDAAGNGLSCDATTQQCSYSTRTSTESQRSAQSRTNGGCTAGPASSCSDTPHAVLGTSAAGGPANALTAHAHAWMQQPQQHGAAAQEQLFRLAAAAPASPAEAACWPPASDRSHAATSTVSTPAGTAEEPHGHGPHAAAEGPSPISLASGGVWQSSLLYKDHSGSALGTTSPMPPPRGSGILTTTTSFGSPPAAHGAPTVPVLLATHSSSSLASGAARPNASWISPIAVGKATNSSNYHDAGPTSNSSGHSSSSFVHPAHQHLQPHPVSTPESSEPRGAAAAAAAPPPPPFVLSPGAHSTGTALPPAPERLSHGSSQLSSASVWNGALRAGGGTGTYSVSSTGVHGASVSVSGPQVQQQQHHHQGHLPTPSHGLQPSWNHASRTHDRGGGVGGVRSSLEFPRVLEIEEEQEEGEGGREPGGGHDAQRSPGALCDGGGSGGSAAVTAPSPHADPAARVWAASAAAAMAAFARETPEAALRAGPPAAGDAVQRPPPAIDRVVDSPGHGEDEPDALSPFSSRCRMESLIESEAGSSVDPRVGVGRCSSNGLQQQQQQGRRHGEQSWRESPKVLGAGPGGCQAATGRGLEFGGQGGRESGGGSRVEPGSLESRERSLALKDSVGSGFVGSAAGPGWGSGAMPGGVGQGVGRRREGSGLARPMPAQGSCADVQGVGEGGVAGPGIVLLSRQPTNDSAAMCRTVSVEGWARQANGSGFPASGGTGGGGYLGSVGHGGLGSSAGTSTDGGVLKVEWRA